MKTIGVREIVKLPINQICVNPENPRHDEVIMDLGEIFIMPEKLSDIFSKGLLQYSFNCENIFFIPNLFSNLFIATSLHGSAPVSVVCIVLI